MKREVFFLLGAKDTVLWSDTSESPLALADSRARWEAIWSRRDELVELAHSHPVGPDSFSAEDESTMAALDDALGKKVRFSLVTLHGYFVRGEGKQSEPEWAASLRGASGMGNERLVVSALLAQALARWEAAGPWSSPERLEVLRSSLSDQLVFVCTHNSRRSHIAHLVGWAAARWHGRGQVQCFSSGTEATEFDRRALAALQRVGVEVAEQRARISLFEAPVPVFSKALDHSSLPRKDFVAVMVCGQADAACPFVPGATRRVSLPYDDPKAFDGTEGEAAAYDECVDRMGRDLVWVMR
jgi:arsenate reductase